MPGLFIVSGLRNYAIQPERHAQAVTTDHAAGLVKAPLDTPLADLISVAAEIGAYEQPPVTLLPVACRVGE